MQPLLFHGHDNPKGIFLTIPLTSRGEPARGISRLRQKSSEGKRGTR